MKLPGGFRLRGDEWHCESCTCAPGWIETAGPPGMRMGISNLRVFDQWWDGEEWQALADPLRLTPGEWRFRYRDGIPVASAVTR